MPQTNTAEAFSADASVFNDQPGDGTPDVDKAFGPAAAATAPTQNAAPALTAPPTGAAVRAAAAAGARAFSGSDTANTTAPTAQPFSVSYEKRGIIIKLDDGELFPPRQATLSPAANQHLDEVAAFLTNYPGRAVIVESHTDSAGAAPENLQLSQNRAEMIRAALLARGGSPGSVTARGYGEDYPVASNVSEDGRAANRRIEIVLLPPGQNGPRYREMFEASSGDLMNNQAGEAPGTNALDLGSDRNM
jgi:outer membrane protein OmpA-like peptidoglycan-associated protein